MSARFKARDGRCVAKFAPAEASLVRQLVGEIVELVDEPEPTATSLDPDDPLAALERELAAPERDAPEDEALARLLPDAYTDDEAASAEHRRFSETGLRAGKLAAARQVLADLPTAGGRVTLERPAAESWLTALNDVRLALGTRLEVTDDLDLDAAITRNPDSEQSYAMAVYAWLGYLQETLVEAVVRTRPDAT